MASILLVNLKPYTQVAPYERPASRPHCIPTGGRPPFSTKSGLRGCVRGSVSPYRYFVYRCRLIDILFIDILSIVLHTLPLTHAQYYTHRYTHARTHEHAQRTCPLYSQPGSGTASPLPLLLLSVSLSLLLHCCNFFPLCFYNVHLCINRSNFSVRVLLALKKLHIAAKRWHYKFWQPTTKK